MIEISTILLGWAGSFGMLFIFYIIKDLKNIQSERKKRGYKFSVWEIFKQEYTIEMVIPIIIVSIVSIIYILIYILEGII